MYVCVYECVCCEERADVVMLALVCGTRCEREEGKKAVDTGAKEGKVIELARALAIGQVMRCITGRSHGARAEVILRKLELRVLCIGPYENGSKGTKHDWLLDGQTGSCLHASRTVP